MTAGAFETIRIRGGRAPFLERHAARLAAACHALHLPAPAPPLPDLVASWLDSPDAVVRVEVGSGGAVVTSRPLPCMEPLALVIAATPHSPYPHKTTTRVAFEAAQAEAQAAGADDALLLTPSGLVAEGTTWSIFWWEGDRVATPALSVGVLPGVARGRVMELTPVVERQAQLGDLAGRGLFATNAVRGVIPIVSLNGAPTPADPRTVRLGDRFWPA